MFLKLLIRKLFWKTVAAKSSWYITREILNKEYQGVCFSKFF